MASSFNPSRLDAMILLVDDVEANRYARSRILSQAGYRVIEASTGEEALRAAAAHRPDLIVLDVNLPDIDGLEVCRRLKSDPTPSHIMVLQVSSARTSKMELAAGLEGGADGYLIEPIDPLELLATVNSLLRLAEREKENRRLIQQLSRSERQFAEATSAADCGMWDWHITDGKLEWFGEHERLAGMLPGGFSGKIDVFSEILHPDDRTRVWAKVQGMMERHEEHFSDEYRFVHPDGSSHWMTARGRFFYDDAGHAVRMTGVVQDITARKAAEDALRRSERRYRTLVQETSTVTWSCPPSGLQVEPQPSWMAFTGQTAEEMLGTGWGNVVHPDDLAAVAQRWSHAVAQGTSFSSEHRIRRQDGEWRWMSVYAKPIRDADGRVLEWFSFSLDITERKQGEEAVRRSEDHLHRVLDAMHVFVGVLTPDGILTQCNTAPLLGAGVGKEEAIGVHFAESFWWNYSEESALRLRRDIERAARGERIRYDTSVRVRNTMGEPVFIDVDFALTPMFDDTGTVTHLILIGIDISARTRAESSLRESEERLRLALDAADMGSWDLDLRTGVAMWNRRHAQVQGYDEEGPHSFEQWRDRVHPGDLNRVLTAIEQAKQTRMPFIDEHRVCLPGKDEVRWLSLYGRFAYDETGQPIRVSGVSVDITERKQSELALHESEQRLRLATEVAAIGIWEWNVVTNEVRWDTRMFEIYGVPPTPDRVVSYQIWREAVLPEDLAGQERVLQHIIRSKGQSGRTFRIKRKNDGACRDIEAVETVRLNEQGETGWVIGTNVDVTESKQAEDALRAAHDTFRHLVEQSPFGVYAVDADFRLVQVSVGAQKVFGQVRPLLGRDFAEVLRILWPEPFASEAIARFRHTLHTGEPYRSSSTVERRHDIGEIESYDWKIERVVLPEGRFGVVCHFYDLSERLRYEQQLAAAKQQLEATLSATEIGVWHWDLTDNRLTTDRNLKQLFGLDGSAEPPAEGYTQRIHPDDFARNQAAIERVVQEGGSYDQQFRVIRPDGTIRWIHSRGKVNDDEQGRRSFVGVVLDITERKHAEVQLRESEGRLQLALQASATGVWDWNLLTDDITWSGHIHLIFGVDHFEGTREAFSRRVHPEDADRLWQTVNHAIAEHVPLEAEFRIIRPSGEVRWVNNFGRAEYDETGRAISLLGTVSDITERKMAEQELRQLKDDLENRVRERTKELLETQERLMGATSQLSLTEQRERRKLARDLHDYLAQMLIVGQMKTDMLKKKTSPQQDSTALLQDLDKLFQDALGYTRTLIAELSPPSLQESGLPAALTWLGERFEKDGLRVDVRADCGSIPLAEEQAVVVFQAVRELLFNVLKHAGVDHATVTLSLSDNVVQVAVADGGKGFHPQSWQRSTEPGHLGLISVRERFRTMGGRVDVDSLPGQGTTVTLALPLTVNGEGPMNSEEKETNRFPSLASPHSPPSIHRFIRVLLVDNHTLVRQEVRDILASDDRIRVVGEAGSCEEALMLAANVDPDVVITDINLPTVNGIETTKRFKALRPRVVVIGLSAQTEELTRQDMRSAGAEALLSKECAADELIPAVISSCSGHIPGR